VSALVFRKIPWRIQEAWIDDTTRAKQTDSPAGVLSAPSHLLSCPPRHQTQPKKNRLQPEFEDVFAQYFKTAAQSKALELNGHYGQEKNKEALT
jgi:hypothetical protein